ncbi:winged helix-turn-helix domain-containing protein [Nesterenkonia sphaerica]|uniref:winged helix-turn-helix domain-containing protein n=1 Tax=Nesterenkonia sphaerica TaxID=1804988 RepID=UPI001FB5D8DB|nr:winged helix-turn-helix domain-containing protein [Nesterenkonia sphaerica]
MAQQYGKREELIAALQTDVLTAAVGAVTAHPLAEAGVEAIVPHRWRLGALIKKVCDHLESHHIVRAETAHGTMEIRGHQVRFPHTPTAPVRLSPAPLALLRELVMADGTVLSREELLEMLPLCDSERALEMLVSRLRKSLQAPAVVQTVVKRGYKLAV